MADAIAALKEAFDAFRKNIAGCLIHTLIFAFSCLIVLGILLAILFVFSIITAGSIVGALFSGTSSVVSLVLVGGALLVLFVGMVISSWLFAGLVGAYYGSLYSFMAARKPTIPGFFSGIPKTATPIFAAELLQGLIIFLPASAIATVATIAGVNSGIPGAALQLLSWLYSMIIGVLTIFIVAAVVVDAKGAASSLRHSVSLVSRNIVPVIIYAVLTFALALPILFAIGVPVVLSIFVKNSLPQVLLGLGVLFSLAYALFFSMPLTALFNLSLYRKLK